MIHFFAPGKPQAKGRSRTRIVGKVIGKQFTQHYTPDNTRGYENMIGSLAKQQMIMRKLTRAPIKLDLVLHFEIPKSWASWKRDAALAGRISHTTKPDADNVIKAIKDALNKVVWYDDAQVTEVHAIKVYSKTPGVQIDVIELPYYPAQITKKSEYKSPEQQELAA